jgi:hypothetical protein
LIDDTDSDAEVPPPTTPRHQNPPAAQTADYSTRSVCFLHPHSSFPTLPLYFTHFDPFSDLFHSSFNPFSHLTFFPFPHFGSSPNPRSHLTKYPLLSNTRISTMKSNRAR